MAGKVGAANDDWKRPILKLERPLLLVVDQESHMAPRHARDRRTPSHRRLSAPAHSPGQRSLSEFTLSMRRIKEPF